MVDSGRSSAFKNTIEKPITTREVKEFPASGRSYLLENK
jgi:hypothetical protein